MPPLPLIVNCYWGDNFHMLFSGAGLPEFCLKHRFGPSLNFVLSDSGKKTTNKSLTGGRRQIFFLLFFDKFCLFFDFYVYLCGSTLNIAGATPGPRDAEDLRERSQAVGDLCKGPRDAEGFQSGVAG